MVAICGWKNPVTSIPGYDFSRPKKIGHERGNCRGDGEIVGGLRKKVTIKHVDKLALHKYFLDLFFSLLDINKHGINRKSSKNWIDKWPIK